MHIKELWIPFLKQLGRKSQKFLLASLYAIPFLSLLIYFLLVFGDPSYGLCCCVNLSKYWFCFLNFSVDLMFLCWDRWRLAFKGGEIFFTFPVPSWYKLSKIKLGSVRRKCNTNRKPVCLWVTYYFLVKRQNWNILWNKTVNAPLLLFISVSWKGKLYMSLLAGVSARWEACRQTWLTKNE